MAKSVTTFEKPLPHINELEWHNKNWELQDNALAKRYKSFEMRNAGKILCSETKVKSEWGTYMNNSRLADRVTELTKWRRLIEDLLNKVLSEMKLLRDEKFDAEKELEALNHPLQVVAECISLRETRRGMELVYDEADAELKKELCVVDNVKDILTKRLQEAWEKLNHLEEVRFKVDLDLEFKDKTIQIDTNNLKLNRNSGSISYKPNSLKSPKHSITYESWLEHSCNIKALADNELNDVYNFREAMHVMRERARNDIKAQQDHTDYTLRRKVYETQRTKNELEWQKLKTSREMEKLLIEINRLEKALLDKTDRIKCAETRLINRTIRPGTELCKDETELGLKDEVTKLKQMQKELCNAIKTSKETYNNFECLLIRTDKSIDDKKHALTTDLMCLDLRSTLSTHDKTRLPDETNRNIVLTRMEEEIPLEP